LRCWSIKGGRFRRDKDNKKQSHAFFAQNGFECLEIQKKNQMIDSFIVTGLAHKIFREEEYCIRILKEPRRLPASPELN
jgi:hypothetical protein